MSGSDYQAILSRDFTREERNSMLHLSGELAYISSRFNHLIFILGSYKEEKKQRLIDVQEAIEQQIQNDAAALLMEEFLGEDEDQLPGHIKFRVIADHVDAIVGVVEDDQGGFTYEQGVIVDNPHLFQKTFVLKRAYSPTTERQKYSWMQATSLFAELEHASRIYEGSDESEYSKTGKELISDLETFLR